MERQFSEQEQVRRDKLEEIRNYCNPYPERYEVTHKIKDARLLEDGTTDVAIAGRIVFMRKMGKLSFVRIRDIEGDMQLEIKIDMVGEDKYAFFKKLIDTGDFIGAKGEIFTTQTGEKTLRVHSFEFLGKALRPLPEKFHGLTDMEMKYRQRYVDLIMNEETRKVFLGRSKLYAYIHKFLGENGFLEVETPILQNAVCGASAKPFYTHHNALDMDCNLRIAPDLTFFFPKDKATGLDVNVNFHYVFNFSKDGQGFSVYPLAGIGMQNNFYGKQDVEVNGVTTQVDRSNSTKFAFNLGGGITLPLSERSFLNAEAKFMFAEDDNVVIMLGYGYKF